MDRRFRFALKVAAAVAMSVSAASTLNAGEWLGGQYWGQISGCACCGGSLYGGAFPTEPCAMGPIGFDLGVPDSPCSSCAPSQGLQQPTYPTPGVPELELREPATGEPIPQGEVEYPAFGRPAAFTQAVPARATAGPTSRRRSVIEDRPVGSTASTSAGRVRTVTHVSQPERLLLPPQNRIVAPNAWSDRVLR